MPRVHVTSEIGALRSVLVHTPGKELVAVTPGTREDYLYDDIIDLEIAQREHRRLVAVLERFAEVHEVRDALVEIAAICLASASEGITSSARVVRNSRTAGCPAISTSASRTSWTSANRSNTATRRRCSRCAISRSMMSS